MRAAWAFLYDPFPTLYDALTALLGGLPAWAVDAIITVLAGGVLLTFAALLVMGLILLERRLVGRFQDRIGPNRVGPNGLLQTVADVLKLLLKEDIIPTAADRWVFLLAPIAVLVPTLLVLAVLPFGPGALLADLNIGLLYFVAISSTAVIGILMAGWGSNNKYSLLGGMRAVAMMLSYEIPIVLSLIGVVLIAGTLSMNGIVEAQARVWFFLLQPLGLLVYLVGAVAESNRTPFDLTEGESEIIAGYHTEYSGMRFGLFFMAEFLHSFIISAVAVTLFFGGWRPLPLLGFLPPWLWFLGKTFVFYFVLVWLRATLPRLRIDQVLGLAWKGLLPLALLNIFLTTIGVELYRSFFA